MFGKKFMLVPSVLRKNKTNKFICSTTFMLNCFSYTYFKILSYMLVINNELYQTTVNNSIRDNLRLVSSL